MKRSISAAFVLAALMAAGHASAATCETTVESNDSMQFNTKEIVVDQSCKQFKVTLKHVGKLPKASMGHNFVVTKTADFAAASKDAAAAGPANDYLKKGDARVIAASKLLGGGESDTITIDTSKLKAGEGYTFFCSYPGHSALMKGVLKF